MRILGGLETLGFKEKADQVRGLIALTGWKKATNPFPDAEPLLSSRLIPKSPYADRIRLLWEQMRPMVLEHFPAAAEKADAKSYLDKAHHLYQYDAYHSLSIEGFQVTPELVARIAAGNDPDNPSIQEENNRLAAKGYSMAHEAVLQSIGKIFNGGLTGKIVESDLPYWYSELHKPFVQVGRLSMGDVAGYREKPVYIRGSSHVPPAPGLGVIDGMEAFHQALSSEPEASVRAILGHFLFVYIHPFSDGNGRIGRFLMNAMLASGGYPWTILRVTRRQAYMDALEEASVARNIIPFTKFVGAEMAVDWSLELAQAERLER
jgi:Fic family protein